MPERAVDLSKRNNMREIIGTAVDRHNLPVTFEVDITYYYGVEYQGYDRGFIYRKDFNSGPFIVVHPCRLTNGNRFSVTELPTASLAEFINHLKPHYKVYEFNNPEDLFKWLVSH